VLIVVDTSPAMHPYRERLVDNLRRLARAADALPADVRIGVISADLARRDAAVLLDTPSIPGCTPPDDPYLRHEALPWYQCDDPQGCVVGNYAGSIDDALACIGALPADGGDTAQPLAAALRALIEPANAGFFRAGDVRQVFVVSASDDASPPNAIVELDALVDEIVAADVATDDWADSFPRLDDVCLDAGCCLPASITGECIVTTHDDALIPPCTMRDPTHPAADTVRPCWWIGPEPPWGAPSPEDCAFEPIVEGVADATWRCEVACND
jgi:hypothetical protein